MGLQVGYLVVLLRFSGTDVKPCPSPLTPPPCWDPNNRGVDGRICWTTAAAASLPTACSLLDIHTNTCTHTHTNTHRWHTDSHSHLSYTLHLNLISAPGTSSRCTQTLSLMNLEPDLTATRKPNNHNHLPPHLHLHQFTLNHTVVTIMTTDPHTVTRDHLQFHRIEGKTM